MSLASSSLSLASDSSDHESDTDTSGSSDLDDLYQSFDFEDEAALDSAETSASASRGSAALSGISQFALFPGAQQPYTTFSVFDST